MTAAIEATDCMAIELEEVVIWEEEDMLAAAHLAVAFAVAVEKSPPREWEAAVAEVAVVEAVAAAQLVASLAMEEAREVDSRCRRK